MSETKFRRHLDALTEEAIRQSLENIAQALSIRYGDCGHSSVEERGWLIEWPAHGHFPCRWWHPLHGWTIDASQALRFARKTDAEAQIRSGRGYPGGLVATEHARLSPPTGGGDGR